ncbi:unnamed protein product [Penicillium pancosmium]
MVDREEHWNYDGQGTNIHQPTRRLSDNIETNTESNNLNGTIGPMELTAPTSELGSSRIFFDAALDEALDSVLMGTHPPSMDACNPSTISHGEQTLSAQLAIESSKEPYSLTANQTAHPFVISQHPSSTGLSPTSFLNTTQDDYFELDELRTPGFGRIGPLSPTPNDIWLDNTSCFAGLASTEQGMEPMTNLMGKPERKAPKKQGDQFEYVLGGIGGEVPLIQ